MGVVIPTRRARSRNDKPASPSSPTSSQAASTIASRAERRRASRQSVTASVFIIARNLYTLYKSCQAAPSGQAVAPASGRAVARQDRGDSDASLKAPVPVSVEVPRKVGLVTTVFHVPRTGSPFTVENHVSAML